MLQLQLLVMLGGIATVAVASAATPRFLPRTTMALAFVALLALAQAGPMATPSTAAAALALISGMMLLKPKFGRRLAPVAAGCIAAHWAASLAMLGAPSVAAVTLAAAALLGATILGERNPHFAPGVLREEALLIVGGLASLLAIAPGIMSGWQSAIALRAAPATTLPLAPWPFAAVGIALVLGSLYAAWSHKRHG